MPCLKGLADRELVKLLKGLVARDREQEAELLAYLGEVDARGLYREEACSSMHAYCTGVLRFCDAQAYNRIHAARLARRFPLILEKLRRGELHLSGINVLGPRLTPANFDELLDAATHKSKRQIECLLADREPVKDAPERIRRLPAPREIRRAAVTRAPMPPTRRTEIQEPLGSQRFRVQFTASPELKEKIDEAKTLLRHSVPSGDLAEVLLRALTRLIEAEKKRQFGLTERPRKSVGEPRGKRAIPAHIRRHVYRRDEGRCTYLSASGRRCESRDFLQYHHEDPWAVHRSHDAARITLRCHAHNQLAAEQYFGRNSSREELPVR
jgi:hypothetical protein